jgi:TolB-like protein/Tfp pilus assembly protein PilF
MKQTTLPVACDPSLLSDQQKALIRAHLDEALSNPIFAGSKRTQDFLRLVVGHSLDGQQDSLHERMIGAELFGRPIGYDTGNDSVVRVRASDARKKLVLYYSQQTGSLPAVRIDLPSGSYVPVFQFLLENDVQSAAVAATSLSASPKEPTNPQPPLLPPVFTRKKRESWPFRLLFAATLLLLLAGLSLFIWSRARVAPGIHAIAVLPLVNLSGSPTQEYFADGVTEELINDLGQVSTLRVTSLTSSMSYKGSKKNLPEIARELGVDAVIEGGILKEGDRVRISTQLIDARADRPIWAHTYVRERANGIDWQGEVAQDIAEQIRIKVTPQEQARLTHKRLAAPDVQDLYLHGILLRDTNHCPDAFRYFQQALAKDPNNADVHSALATCYGMLGESGRMPYLEAFSKQKIEAQRAIDLDDSLSEAHAERGNAAMTFDRDWALAETEFKRALALNPSSSTNHEKYAFFLVRTGHPQEALAEIAESVALDPVSASTFHAQGFIDYFARQYDKALEVVQTARGLKIDLGDWNFLRGDIEAGKGRYPVAIVAFQQAGSGPYALGHLGYVYARTGQRAAAEKLIAQLERTVRQTGIGRYEIALIYVGLGDKDHAFQWLEEAYREHDVGLVYLKVDPCLDPLRTDPRFGNSLRRVGLQP